MTTNEIVRLIARQATDDLMHASDMLAESLVDEENIQRYKRAKRHLLHINDELALRFVHKLN